jgi:hypothetical protein
MDLLLSHPPRVVGVNRFPFAPGERIAPRANSSLMVCVVTAGNGELTVRSQRWPLAAGQVAVMPWGQRWSLLDQGGLVVLTVHLRFLPWSAPEAPILTWFSGPAPTAADRAPDLGCGPVSQPSPHTAPTAEAILAA